jgi:hypothetical protein
VTGVSYEVRPGLRGVLLAASDSVVVQAIAARFARSPLVLEEMRDIKLVTLLIETDSGHLSGKRHLGTDSLVYSEDSTAHLASLGGISRDRVAIAIGRLLEAGVLAIRDGVEGQLVFTDRVLRPAGAAEYVDWQSVGHRLQGRMPALLVLRSVLDAMRAPWDWTSLTYDVLATHSSYSLGMARHGVTQLLKAGVLDRSAHAGRGHEYRCSSWALGRGTDVVLPSVPVQHPVLQGVKAVDTSQSVPSSRATVGNPVVVATQDSARGSVPIGASNEMTVEVGGLVLRLPVGTEIHMRLDGNSVSYEIGPHLRLKQQIDPS